MVDFQGRTVKLPGSKFLVPAFANSSSFFFSLDHTFSRFPEPPKERRGGAQTEILAEVGHRESHGTQKKKGKRIYTLED